MYQIHFPAETLRPFIECYWIARAPAREPLALQESVFVDGKADIVFNFGVAYQRSRLGDTPLEAALAVSNVDAQRSYPVVINQQGAIDLVGVRFRPGGLAAFLPMPAYELTGYTLSLGDGLGSAAYDLEGRLFDSRGDSARQIALLDSFFLSRLQHTLPLQIAHQLAIHIERAGGAVNIHHLSRKMGYSIRSVDRFFQQFYGFSPKFYARVVRFQRTLRGMIQQPETQFQEIAFAADYYDQSHFNKDFAAFTGDSPEHYRTMLIARAAAPPPNLNNFYQP